MGLAQKIANNKNPQFQPNQANILSFLSIHELAIFTQFHNDIMKIWDFLLIATILASPIFSCKPPDVFFQNDRYEISI